MDRKISEELNENKVVIWMEEYSPNKWWNLIIFGPFMLAYIVWQIKKICNKYHWPLLEYRRAVIEYNARKNAKYDEEN